MKDVNHYAQYMSSKEVFDRYDYGEKGNVEEYGQPTPPLFDLKDYPINVRAPGLSFNHFRNNRTLLHDISQVFNSNRHFVQNFAVFVDASLMHDSYLISVGISLCGHA